MLITAGPLRDNEGIAVAVETETACWLLDPELEDDEEVAAAAALGAEVADAEVGVVGVEDAKVGARLLPPMQTPPYEQ